LGEGFGLPLLAVVRRCSPFGKSGSPLFAIRQKWLKHEGK
jgi:hypothetical protein